MGVNFIEDILTLPVAPDETVEFLFSTSITENQRGEERRIPSWLEYRTKIKLDLTGLTKDELVAIQTFYKLTKGSVSSFRYKSQIEYKVTNTPDIYYETLDYSVSSGGNLYLISGNDYQLVKVYAQDEDKWAYKTIRYPDISTFGLYINGVLSTGYLINPLTGVVTFTTAPPVNATLRFSGEYYHEVHFVGNSLSASQTADSLYSLSIQLAEEVNSRFKTYRTSDFTELSSQFILPFEPSKLENTELTINVESLPNGRESRVTRALNSKDLFNLEGTIVTEKEKGLLLTWFLVCKGRLLGFNFENHYARFNNDSLSFSNMRSQDDCLYYRYNNLAISKGEQIMQTCFDGSVIPITETCPNPPYFPLPVAYTGYTCSSLRVNPNNPTDAVILASNPTSGYATGGDPTVKTYDLIACSQTSQSMISLPPGGAVGNGWRVAQMFWEANTLWLVIVATGTTVNNWRNRAALYKLNATGNQFDYVESGLKNFGLTNTNLTDHSLCATYQTPTGTSLFFLANNTTTFGTVAATVPNGLARLEIKFDGSQLVDFIPNSLIPVSASIVKPEALYNNTDVILQTSNTANNNYYLGSINGLNYYAGSNLSRSQASAYPVNNSGLTGTNAISRETYPHNFYAIRTNSKQDIYLNNALGVPSIINTLYSNSPSVMSWTNSIQTQDNNLLINIAVTSECAEGLITCSTGTTFNSHLIYFRSQFDSTPILFAKLTRIASSANANYQLPITFNSGSFNKTYCDKYGNILAFNNIGSYFWRAKTQNCLNINSLIPEKSSRTNKTNTPYGFATIAHGSDLFGAASTYPTLTFLRYEEPNV